MKQEIIVFLSVGTVLLAAAAAWYHGYSAGIQRVLDATEQAARAPRTREPGADARTILLTPNVNRLN
tara:strand:- start:608 stop:808 length:201 start_codon:yes stop_codon:yes gene_type:complete